MSLSAPSRLVLAPVVTLLVLLVGGCSAAGPGVRPTAAPPSVPVPVGGVSLATLGWNNGPAAAVTLPAGVQLSERVDQPNVLIATISAPGADEVHRWLETQLPAGGFTITASRDRSLTFTGHGWHGAFTAQAGLSALTLRKDP